MTQMTTSQIKRQDESYDSCKISSSLEAKSTKKQSNSTYPCSKCSKVFTYLSSLSRHQSQAHEGRGRVICDQCGIDFSRQDCLKRHINAVHKGLGKVTCEKCQARLVGKWELARHMKTVHQKKSPRFQCDQCEDPNGFFTRKDQLKRHIAHAHEGYRVTCVKCYGVFYDSSALGKHMRSEHSIGSRELKKEMVISRLSDNPNSSDSTFSNTEDSYSDQSFEDSSSTTIINEELDSLQDEKDDEEIDSFFDEENEAESESVQEETSQDETRDDAKKIEFQNQDTNEFDYWRVGQELGRLILGQFSTNRRKIVRFDRSRDKAFNIDQFNNIDNDDHDSEEDLSRDTLDEHLDQFFEHCPLSPIESLPE